MDLKDILGALGVLPEKDRDKTVAEALKATATMLWVPNPGPQTDAYFCKADELFYGGQAGGGKSDLEIGAAVTAHHRSLLLRRTNKEALGLVERTAEIVGNRDGWSGQAGIWRLPDATVEISGCQLEEDKQKFKGSPHDLICFDEVSDFTESQYTFIIGWNRSAKPGQRCRVIAAGNPPTSPEGLWVLKRWGAWLDPTHPNPAKPGELRWYTTGADGKELEVDGPGPHMIGGESVMARSRTFIPAKLSDNPDLADTNYAATLAALPEELRGAYRDGRFDLGLKDKPFQVIPTGWIRAAQTRWTDTPPAGIPMCSIAADASGGGNDPMVIASRYDGWFAPLIEIPGKDIPMARAGAFCGGLILSYRRDSAPVCIDMSGGYGASMYEHLMDNGIEPMAYKGAEKAAGKDKSNQFDFANKRSRALWKLREALDPETPGGSRIALPNDPTLVSDLTAPSYEVKGRKIHVESKEDVCDRLGRSTDRGDAVVMCWANGLQESTIKGGFAQYGRNRKPEVIMGRPTVRRR